MAKVSDVTVDATWCRFTDYHISNGYIMASPPFHLEDFSLLDEIDRSKSEKAGAIRLGPHEEFANLDTRDEQAVLNWYRRWGSLGFLPHYLKYATFEGNRVAWAPNVHSDRIYSPWRPRLIDGITGRNMDDVTRDVYYGIAPGTVVYVDQDTGWGGNWDVAPADVFFRKYFPLRDASEGYPLPMTEYFWPHYCERLSDVAFHVIQMRSVLKAIETIQLAHPGEKIRDNRELDNAVDYATHFINTHAILRPELPVVGPNGFNPERRVQLATTTLWSALATLVWLDWGEGRKVSSCKACGKFFVTSLGSKDYCGPTCKKTAEMRRWRERQREKKRQGEHEQGG